MARQGGETTFFTASFELDDTMYQRDERSLLRNGRWLVFRYVSFSKQP